MNLLITGGAGFIGSHLVRHFVRKYPHYQIINFDKLTYAGNLLNLRDLESASNYRFVKGDICNPADLNSVFAQFQIQAVIHLAAESHVDRSILNPTAFVETNVLGTVHLLNTAKQFWQTSEGHLFYHVSTDEVYGSLGETGFFTEQTPYQPHSPYSASKASSDHFVRAWYDTYRFPVVLSNCSNNYGPFQFPEKLIPLTIRNAVAGNPLPVYGKGENVRDWLFVGDHCTAIDLIFHRGKQGETYNIGGKNELPNLFVVQEICRLIDLKCNRPAGETAKLIRFVTDRPGHDFRYAIDCSKLENELGWKPSLQFSEGLETTIDWYLANEPWLASTLSGEYQRYYEEQYQNRI